jgi:7,8-dihydroneopterin aldolase/epimerase/oxygenase
VRELERTLDRLGARVGEERARDRLGRELREPVAEIELRQRVEDVRGLHQAAGLLGDRAHERGMRVANAGDSPARHQVDVLLSEHVDHTRAAPARERHGKALHDRQEVRRLAGADRFEVHGLLRRHYSRGMRDVILLQGIQVPAALGVTAVERRMRRPVLLDLEIARDLREAGRSDSIRHTIHYKRIFEIVEDVAGNQQHKLVEALGDRIARAVLAKFDADEVVVTVRKPTPIAGVLQYAGVRIARTRDDL